MFFVNIAIIFSELKPPSDNYNYNCNCSELKLPWRLFSLRSGSRTCRHRRSVARSSFNMMLYIKVIIGDKYMMICQNQTWRLNERHYGGLTGLNKAETAEKHGEAQVSTRLCQSPTSFILISDFTNSQWRGPGPNHNDDRTQIFCRQFSQAWSIRPKKKAKEKKYLGPNLEEIFWCPPSGHDWGSSLLRQHCQGWAVI